MSTRWTENDIPWLLDTPENLKLHGYPKIADRVVATIAVCGTDALAGVFECT